jgi:hypothetical protein
MIDFDDTLGDELGEDFGIINTPTFARSKWRELRLQWTALVSPYAKIGVGTIPAPSFVANNYKLWLAAHKAYVDGWTNAVDLWRTEFQRYTNTYNYIEQLRALNSRTPNANLNLTPSASSSGASLPSDINPQQFQTDPDSKVKLFDPSTWELNFGQVALLGLGTFVAYNVFFRLREGRRRV